MATASEAMRWGQWYRDQPIAFVEEVLDAKFYAKQAEMVLGVRDHPRVAVVGCNGSGKDYAAGRILLWWQSTRYPAVTVVIGPTHRQVHDILWKEVRSGYRSSKWPLGGKMYRRSRWESDDRHFAVGFATDDEFNIQGFHSPNLLVILTEAHNLERAQVDAVKRLNPFRLLMTGNPLVSSGEFFAAFHESGDMYHPIHISAFDTPNVAEGKTVVPGMVTRDVVSERLRDWGEESALYIGSVLGKFPDNPEDAVVSRSLLMAAVGRQVSWDVEEPPPAVLGCDVARFGEDQTVVYRRQGGVCRVVWKVRGRDTQQIAGKLGLLAAADGALDRVVVDDTGVGGGVTDRLREEGLPQGVRLVAFNGGATARRSDRYVNAITEAWLEMAEAFKEGRVSIDDNPDLIAQLSSRRYTIHGDRRLRLEPKGDYKRRVRISPDDADALALTYGAMLEQPPNLRFL